MDDKTKAAWIIHHSHKLRNVTGLTGQYEQIDFSGRCGILLSALAGSEASSLENKKVETLAKANGIAILLELPTILNELERQRLISRGESGIEVLGLTSSGALEHTATIFQESGPHDSEEAALSFSEMVSELPVVRDEALEYVSDNFHATKKNSQGLLRQFEQIGFVDAETVSDNKLYFNGNLFRRDEIVKVNGVLSSLSSQDEKKINELSAHLCSCGCIAKPQAEAMLGKTLHSKLVAIGFFDQNTIGNEQGTFSFITRPAAFSKFTNALVDDAFDLAKAFVTSLTYGMSCRDPSLGHIRLIEPLMNKLINGQRVGPATAIGQDYKVLELKGVLQLEPAGNGRFYMKLLKKDVGELALKVILEGDASAESLPQFPGASATSYTGPEPNRTIIRKKQTEPLKQGVANLLDDLRTGGVR